MQERRKPGQLERPVIEAALIDEVVENGYPQATVDGVCARAGVERDDFNRYFTDMQDGYCQILEALDAEIFEKLLTAFDGQESWCEQVRAAARLFAGARNGAIYYGLGVTEHSQGSTMVMGIANLAMLTGNVGREGVGVNPLRGQNNVQGSCYMGSFPHEFPGYRHVSNTAVRELFERGLKIGGINVGRFFDQRHDYVTLATFAQMAAEKFPPFVAVFAFCQIRMDRLTARRAGGDNRNVQIAVQRHGHGPWNGRGSHDKIMRIDGGLF